MLERRFIKPNLLEVVETIHGWKANKVTYWYYDTEKWLKSLTGKEGEQPTYPMNENDISWCKKYHIPAAKKLDNVNQNC